MGLPAPQVAVIVAELDGHNPEKDKAVTDLLAAAGFEAEPERMFISQAFVHRDARARLGLRAKAA